MRCRPREIFFGCLQPGPGLADDTVGLGDPLQHKRRPESGQDGHDGNEEDVVVQSKPEARGEGGQQ